MSRATYINEKVIAHIEGYPGSGKTTLMNELKKEFPNLIFVDIDKFSNIAYFKLLEQEKEPFDHMDEWYSISQDEYEKWRSKQTKPIVLVGWGDGFDFKVETPNGKLLLGTNSFKSIWRSVKRDRTWRKSKGISNQKSLPVEYLNLLRKQLIPAFKYKRKVKKEGYESMTSNEIRKRLKELSRVKSK